MHGISLVAWVAFFFLSFTFIVVIRFPSIPSRKTPVKCVTEVTPPPLPVSNPFHVLNDSAEEEKVLHEVKEAIPDTQNIMPATLDRADDNPTVREIDDFDYSCIIYTIPVVKCSTRNIRKASPISQDLEAFGLESEEKGGSNEQATSRFDHNLTPDDLYSTRPETHQDYLTRNGPSSPK